MKIKKGRYNVETGEEEYFEEEEELKEIVGHEEFTIDFRDLDELIKKAKKEGWIKEKIERIERIR